MLGLCDDLRDKATFEMDRMVESLQPPTATNSKSTKRYPGLTEPVGDLDSPKRVRLRGEDEQGLLCTISDRTPCGMDLLYYSCARLFLTWEGQVGSKTRHSPPNASNYRKRLMRICLHLSYSMAFPSRM
jgi:hypothetical protein